MAPWLRNRWSEPESRVAVAAILGAVGSELTGKIDMHSMALLIATAVLAFIFPSTQPAP